MVESFGGGGCRLAVRLWVYFFLVEIFRRWRRHSRTYSNRDDLEMLKTSLYSCPPIFGGLIWLIYSASGMLLYSTAHSTAVFAPNASRSMTYQMVSSDSSHGGFFA